MTRLVNPAATRRSYAATTCSGMSCSIAQPFSESSRSRCVSPTIHVDDALRIADAGDVIV